MAVMAERRAKMAKLRSEHFVADRDVTSAPHITSVDEYSDSFGVAERRERFRDNIRDEATEDHKIFYAGGNKNKDTENKKSDLSFNPLIAEASRRGKTAKTSNQDSSAGEEYLQGKVAGNGYDDGTMEKNISVVREQSSKFYQDGEYLNSPAAEDLGYQSGVSSPNDSLRRAAENNNASNNVKNDEETVLKPKQLLKLEPAIDPLSVSLPETFLKSVKSDLSQSIKSTMSTKSRVHYDPRIFSNNKKNKDEPDHSNKKKDATATDPEKEYFEGMSRWYGEINSKFPGDKTPKTSEANNEVIKDDIHGDNLECIDLEEPGQDDLRVAQFDGRNSVADTVSIKTEFDDPDLHGRSRRRKVGGVRNLMQSIGQTVVNMKTSNMRAGSADSEQSWARRSATPSSPDSRECKNCKQRRGVGCWSVIGLLLIDVVTLIMLISGYNTLRSFHQGIN